jgi:rod shape determining protein RodA
VSDSAWTVLRRADRPTLILAILLATAGILTVASAGGEAAEELWRGQAKFLAAGVSLLAPLVVVPYGRLLRRAWLVYAALIGCLVLTALVGPVINGSQRWLRIGFNFQPSEPLKIVLVLLLARLFRFARPERPLLQWGAALLWIAVPVVLVARQPDLGTSLLYVPVGLAVLFTAGLPWRGIALLGLAGLVLGTITFLFLLKPYQRERIRSTVFREQLADYEKAREGYQLGQSILAVRSGDVMGHGFGRGPVTQSGRLPYAYSDFAFAAVAEEGGFIGAAGILLLILLLVLSIFRIALLTRDPQGRLICVGIGTLIATQSAVNVGVALGVVPTTGMPLPFVSHGGSALVSFLVGVGFVLNVSARRTSMLGPGEDDR